MKTVTYYSGEIEAHRDGCFVGDERIDCPQEGQSLFQQSFMWGEAREPGTSNLRILPQSVSLDMRNDFVFISVFLAVIFGLCVAGIFKVKFFGKTFGEYLRPIWYLVLITIATVFWQYIFGATLEGNSIFLRISQLVWEACIAVSAYKLIKSARFGYGNLFFLGVLYSLIIHGLKVSIRYFFYAQTLWYVLDRFLYGSLLVMTIVFVGGSMFLFFRRKGLITF